MFRKLFIILFCGFHSGSYLLAQNIAVNTSGTAAAALNMFEVTQINNNSNSVGIFSSNTGTGTNAYAIWAEATGATNKYAIVVPSGGGNVGIGTITPQTLLQIISSNTNTNIGTLAFADIPISFRNSSATNNNFSLFSFQNAGNFGTVVIGAVQTDHTAHSGEFVIMTSNASARGERLRVDKAGNVGIGTSTPGTLLHVFSSAAVPVQVKAEQTNTATITQFIATGESANAIIYMRQTNSGLPGSTFGNQPMSGSLVSGTDNFNGLILNSSHITAPMVFVTGGSTLANERMRILGTGNVGIGTSTPGSTLAVHSANIPVITSGGGGNLAVNTKDAQAADVGAWLSLGGLYDATTTTPFAALFGRKENSTSSQYPGYLAFATSKHGTGLVEAMRITSTGLVGIGTVTPTATLEIKSGSASGTTEYIYSTNSAVYSTLFCGNDLGNGPNMVSWGSAAASTSFGLPRAGLQQFTGAGGTVVYGAASNHFAHFITNSLVRMTIDNAGLVGIGTTNPGVILEVSPSAFTAASQSRTGLKINPTGFGSFVSNALNIEFGSSTLAVLGAEVPAGGNRYDFVFSNFSTTTNFTEKVRITGTGNLGIGTISPSQKLEINGGMMLNTATAQPACTAATRGLMWFVQGAAGVKDKCEVCAKDVGDVYAWRLIY